MLKFRWLILSLVLLFSSSVYAQDNIELGEDILKESAEGVIEQRPSDNVNSGNDISLEDEISDEIENNPNVLLDGIASAIGESAQKNILDSEQVFCYQIATPPENYKGYTLDGMAIVGFCGVIDGKLRNLIISELMGKTENILFNQFEDCMIRPQIMLRFMRGVDTTDVLMSSPCHALAFFYAGKVSTFNAKPASVVIDNLVRSLLKNKIDFVSPTLFNQMLPVGVAKTEEQKLLLDKKNTPFRRWEQQKQDQENKLKGWNKLKKRQ